jgi:hypothetical protein
MSTRTWLLAFACVFAPFGVAHASWIPNGTPVATGAGSQELPAALPDGAGGAYIAYLDDASGTLRPYLKRIGNDGTLDLSYGAGGVSLGKVAGPNTTLGPVIADAPGGAIYVAWKDDSVRVQCLIGTNRAFGWPLAGVALCRNELAFSQYFNLKLAVDGTGAAHVFWDVNFDTFGNSVAHAVVTPAATIAFKDCLGNGCGTDRFAGFLTVRGWAGRLHVQRERNERRQSGERHRRHVVALGRVAFDRRQPVWVSRARDALWRSRRPFARRPCPRRVLWRHGAALFSRRSGDGAVGADRGALAPCDACVRTQPARGRERRRRWRTVRAHRHA